MLLLQAPQWLFKYLSICVWSFLLKIGIVSVNLNVNLIYLDWGLPRSTSDKECTCQFRRHKDAVGFLSWKDPLKEEMAVFLPGKSHGQRSRESFTVQSHRVEPDWSGLTRTQVLWLITLLETTEAYEALLLNFPSKHVCM